MNSRDSLASLANDQSLTATIELIEQAIGRLQAGESLDIEALAAAHPEQAAALRELAPAMRVLADLGASASNGEVELSPCFDPHNPAAGVLADFRILREVGRGGMGVVYEAWQLSLNRRVALKVLPFAAAFDPKTLQRFKIESQAAAQLHHTHIVPVYGVGCEKGVHFFAMQFIDGRTLAELIVELSEVGGKAEGGHQGSGDRSQEAEGRIQESGVRNQESEGRKRGTGFLARHNSLGRPGYTQKDGAGTKDETLPLAQLSTDHARRSSAFYRTIARLGIEAAEAARSCPRAGRAPSRYQAGQLVDR